MKKFNFTNVTKAIIKFSVFIIFFGSCKESSKIEYPRKQDLEKMRVCKQILQRKTIKFKVKNKFVFPLKNNLINSVLPEIKTNLKNNIYVCSFYRLGYNRMLKRL